MADVDIDVDINTDDAINDIRRLNVEVNRFDDRIRRADDTTKKFERRLGGSFRQALQDVRVLLGAIGIGVFLRELVSVNAAFEQVKTTLVAASESMDVVASDFGFIRSEAQRLGMPVKQVGGEFARLAAATKGTTLEGGPAREIFSSLAEAFVATGQGADEFRLAVLAVNQMVSKGRVQAEELRGQLGERLPGAYQAAARALKMTTAELSKALEMGQVTAEKLLPALSTELRKTFGSAFEVAKNSPRFIMGQFQVAIESLLYTLSNQGFMVEFLGMLKDISAYLASDEGTRGAERLGNALGFLMSQVRAVANAIVQNLDAIVAVTAGLGSGAAILGIRSLVLWIGNLAKAAGLLKLLMGPWGWLATAIGIAVGMVARYGDSLVTLGGQTARLGDWFKATFQIGSEAIRNDLLPALDKMISDLPIIGAIFEGIKASILGFTSIFKQTGDLTLALKGSIAAFVDVLKEGLGEERWAALVGAFNSIKSAIDAVKPYVDQFFYALTVGAQLAWIGIQEFGKMFWGVLVELYDSAKNIVMDIWSVLSGLGTLLSGLFGQMDWGTILNGLIVGATFVVDVVVGLALSLVDTIEFAVDLVSKAFALLMPILEPIAKAIGAVFAEIVEYVNTIFNLKMDTSQFDTLATALKVVAAVAVGVVSAVGGILHGVSNVVGQVLSAVFDVIGGIWTAFEDVVSLIWDAIVSIGSVSMQSAQVSAEAQVQGAQTSGSAWIKAGDIGVGVFISIIEIVGQVIKQLSNLVQAIVEVGRRFANFFGAISDGFEAMASRDAVKAQAAKDRFTQIFSEPISVGFANDFKAFTDGFGDNFNVVSSAVDFAGSIQNSFKGFGTDIADNFGRVGGAARSAQDRAFGANSELVTDAERNGVNLAAAFFGGYANEIANRASDLTDSATEQQRLLDQAQRDAASNAAKAYAEREAGIDRTPQTELDKSKGGGGSKGRGGKSNAERAQDRIKELAVEIMMNNQLTKSLENQTLTQEQLEATIKATEALRRSGYDMTYEQAIANGGLAQQLAALAYEAEMTEQKLDKAKKAAQAFGEISVENKGLETQLRAAQNLAVNREEYGFQLEAMKELQQAGINMTYEEAIAAGGLAEALAKVAYQRAILKDQISDTESVATAIEGYQAQAAALNSYVEAAARGVTSSTYLDATVAAQNAVMQANGDTLWESYEALDANEKKLYDLAYAQSLASASGKTWVGLSQEISQAYNAMIDPLQNGRDSIMQWSSTTTASLQAMYDQIINKTPEIVFAYQQMMDQINKVTQVEMMRNSTSLSDRFGAWIIDSKAEVNDWAGNITSVFDSAFNQMTDVLTEFVMTGKLQWKELALSVIQEITKMIIKWLVWQAIRTAASFMGIPIPFADGGVMTPGGSMPLKAYSNGGVANSPQLALYGEGRQPEAYVPLPDGRTIPVTLSGLDGMASQSIVNNYVSFDPTAMLQQFASVDSALAPRTDGLSAADARRSDQVYTENNKSTGDIYINTEVTYQSSGGSQGSGPSESDQKAMANMSKELSQMIRTQVIEVVRDETRPGGHFNKLGRRDGF